MAAGVRAAAKGRPVERSTADAADDLASAVEDALRLDGRADVTSEEVGRLVLERLREVDQVAAVRFASVYLGFDDLADFEREVTLLAKRTEPKRHEPRLSWSRSQRPSSSPSPSSRRSRWNARGCGGRRPDGRAALGSAHEQRRHGQGPLVHEVGGHAGRR